MSNLWLLTEERPKTEVLRTIFEKFAKDMGFAVFIDVLRIFPIRTIISFWLKYTSFTHS